MSRHRDRMRQSTLTLAPRGSGPARRAGGATRRLAAAGGAGAAAATGAVWLLGGLSAGGAAALFMSLLFVGAMALHIADHVEEFLER